MFLAPVILFVFNRLSHTQQTVEALRRNELADISELIVFSDGPKRETDKLLVKEVRKYISSLSGFKSVQVIERDKNFGLANSVIDGVTQVINRFGKVIVVEDDLVTSKYFLRYMNEALDKYQNSEQVISVHAYCYPMKQKLPETFFLRGADCWGWGTWKRGWDIFEKDSQKLLHEIQNRHLAYEFDWDGAYANTKMLQKQIRGEIDSWAIRWHASAFLQGKLTLFPGRSLVINIGGDAIATHTKNLDRFQTVLSEVPIVLNDIPLEENKEVRKAVSEFFRSSKPTLFQRLRSLLT